MSKQDTRFINVFSLVLGILAAITILIFFLARYVGGRAQDREIHTEIEYTKHAAKRVTPFAHEVIVGHDTLAPAARPRAGASPMGGSTHDDTAGIPTTGKELFRQSCSACHGPGVAGAPKAGDRAEWAPRIAKGLPTLYQHALNGFHGRSGVMPAKGGRPTLPDAAVKRAVNYMVSLVDPALVKGKPK